MPALPTYFTDFLKKIRLTANQVADCKKGHETLRQRLQDDEDLKDVIVSTFLQGSYRRATAVRPLGESRSDVDVIVVTNLPKDDLDPGDALGIFVPFLEKHYPGKLKPQGRSWGIELSYVELDLVPTSAPSEVAQQIVKSASVLSDLTLEEATDWRPTLEWLPLELRPGSAATPWLAKSARAQGWKAEPLWIPDREAEVWEETDPLTQVAVTQTKNKACNGHFVNVVKCLKWWRKAVQPEPKYPKSYPLEHLVYLQCGDGITSVAEGVVSALEGIRDTYADYAQAGIVPCIPDHGVPEHDVLHRLTPKDFTAFHKLVTDAAGVARRALDEEDVREGAILWRQLFGDRFPDPPPKKGGDNGGGGPSKGGYTPRKEASIIGGGRFA